MSATTSTSNPLERALRRRGWKILIDVSLFVGFIVEFLTREGPDYALHSWVGIVLIPVIAVHLISNGSWIRRVLVRRRDDPEYSLAVLNTVLGALAVICIITGFPIWFDWVGDGIWVTAHTATGLLSIVLMFVHLWRNRRRIKAMTRRRVAA